MKLTMIKQNKGNTTKKTFIWNLCLIVFEKTNFGVCHDCVIYKITAFTMPWTPFLKDLFGPMALVFILQNSECF